MHIVGTAGHVDHGKSTLIEALTDNTANLQEELNRLANETFQHVQLVLTAYQESIQSLAPLAEKKAQ